MADTQRTKAAILALFADNVTGNISAQDLRDFVVTMMEVEFVNPGDFWAQPSPANITTDKTVKGWIEYSQIMTSDISFGKLVYRTASGEWQPATASVSTQNALLGVAADSYAAANSQAQVLRRGVVYDSGLSGRFSGYIGALLYLQGSALLGSISVTAFTSVRIVGAVEPNGIGSVVSGKWRFDPEWAIAGT